MRLVRSLAALAVCVSALVAGTADPAAAQFTIGGDPRVNPNDFRITTFATRLNFPNGLARLSDGSLLVATSNPNGKGIRTATGSPTALVSSCTAIRSASGRVSRSPETWSSS